MRIEWPKPIAPAPWKECLFGGCWPSHCFFSFFQNHCATLPKSYLQELFPQHQPLRRRGLWMKKMCLLAFTYCICTYLWLLPFAFVVLVLVLTRSPVLHHYLGNNAHCCWLPPPDTRFITQKSFCSNWNGQRMINVTHHDQCSLYLSHSHTHAHTYIHTNLYTHTYTLHLQMSIAVTKETGK